MGGSGVFFGSLTLGTTLPSGNFTILLKWKVLIGVLGLGIVSLMGGSIGC